MKRHVAQKYCKGCRKMRRRTQFSDWQWKTNQSFCSIGACSILNDPRSKRFQLLNQDKSMQSMKGKKRGMGSFNAHANQDSLRQASKGTKRDLGAYNTSTNLIRNQGSLRQACKGRKRKLADYNRIANQNSLKQAEKGKK